MISGIVYQAKADSLNETRTFFVDITYDASGRTQISATLRKISENAYWYAEDAVWNALESTPLANHSAALNDLAVEFDSRIYPKLREFFGSEWNPGIDNDSKITILLEDITPDAGGYFNPSDEYPKEQIIEDRSNEREMIYLNIRYLLVPRLREFLAHEFQHLITFNQKDRILGKEEDIWLDETRSEYAITYAGYDSPFIGSNLQRRKTDFLAVVGPSDSLTEWRNGKADYANVNLFGQYLVDRFGSAVMTKIIQTPKTGIKSADGVLQSFNPYFTFSRVFGDWLIAAFFNDCSLIEANRFCYQNPNLMDMRVSPTRTFTLNEQSAIAFSQTTKDWAGYWYRFNQWAKILKVEFSSQNQNSRLRVFCLLNEFSGKIEIREITFNPQDAGGEKGIIYFSNEPPQFNSVLCIPFNQYKTDNFSYNDPTMTFAIKAEILQSQPVISPTPTPTPTPTSTPTPTPTFTPTPMPTPTFTPTPTPSCPNGNLGNLNCDLVGKIDEIDLNILLKSWSSTGPVPSPLPGQRSADLNNNSKVDEIDLNILLRNWNSS